MLRIRWLRPFRPFRIAANSSLVHSLLNRVRAKAKPEDNRGTIFPPHRGLDRGISGLKIRVDIDAAGEP